MTSKQRRTRIKICGMTEPDKVRAAVAMGVDAIGMILHADSPRQIDVSQAKQIRAEVPAFVSLVGVFVNADAEQVIRITNDCQLDLIQLHGDETNQFGESLNRPFIKAIRARAPEQVAGEVDEYPDASAILLDPYVESMHGGTGQQLDLSLWPTSCSKNMILAGGLSPVNVVSRVRQFNPYAVDMNSGLEVSPGVKDINLMRSAVKSIRDGD